MLIFIQRADIICILVQLKLKIEEVRRGAGGILERSASPPKPSVTPVVQQDEPSSQTEKGFEMRQEIQSLKKELKMAHSALVTLIFHLNVRSVYSILIPLSHR